jgi:hypothetical protein
VATSVAGRSLGTRLVWVRRSIGRFGCLFVALGLTVANAAADQPQVVPLWPENLLEARPAYQRVWNDCSAGLSTRL